ncbi:MAG: BatA and WFA domain-containing protein, partial [Clostridiales bacterium]|nr:BatA and WFA domain-containing protein [Clostridiales bacterium]
MRLAIPLGLLGLITVAVLILIYIFKPKYQDKKFSSTYIWKLSLKYVKRKVPFQWLQNSLLFIVQLLILALIAVSMSFPQVVLDSKDGEKIVVLDASASMSAVIDGKSRFERAKNEIIDMVDDTTKSHKISIIIAGGQSSFLIRRTDSASYAKQKLFEAECGMTDSDVSGSYTPLRAHQTRG